MLNLRLMNAKNYAILAFGYFMNIKITKIQCILPRLNTKLNFKRERPETFQNYSTYFLTLSSLPDYKIDYINSHMFKQIFDIFIRPIHPPQIPCILLLSSMHFTIMKNQPNITRWILLWFIWRKKNVSVFINKSLEIFIL